MIRICTWDLQGGSICAKAIVFLFPYMCLIPSIFIFIFVYDS